MTSSIPERQPRKTMVCQPSGELWSPPIYVHFNDRDSRDRLRLDKPGTREDIERYSLRLAEGQRLVLFDIDGDASGKPDDLITVGAATYDMEERRWVADALGATIHFSDLDQACKERYSKYRPQMAAE